MMRSHRHVSLLASLLALVALAAPAQAQAKTKRTVTAELRTLLAAGQIDQLTYTSTASAYNAAKRTVRTLSGARKTQLSAVIKNVEADAKGRRLVPARLLSEAETLRRNTTWWSTGKPLAKGARISFPESELVWQYYPGQGLQIQWLATFGKANGYFTSTQNTKFKKLLDEALPYANTRAGGIAWEYMFKFGGGSPPWVSGMAQATAIQTYARAGAKYAPTDPARSAAYLDAAYKGLGVFKTPAPEGIRVDTPVGAHYLIYSYSRSLRVLNAFTQSVIGLRDYAKLTGNTEGLALYVQGEAQLRSEIPFYDTGSWSRYSQLSESDLPYHKLLTGFLKTMCKYVTEDAASATVAPPGFMPVLDPAIYCDKNATFTSYLTIPPVVELLSTTVRRSKSAPLKFSLSKAGSVNVTATRDGQVIFSRRFSVGGGTRTTHFKASAPGPVDVKIDVTDMAGNKASTSGVVTVRR